MKYTLVKPDGSLGETRNFDGTPPVLALNKGRWLPDNPPAFNSATHVLTKVLPVFIAATEIEYQAIWRPVEEIRSEKLTELDQAYDTAVQSAVSYMGTTFQTDYDSQDILIKTLTSLNPVGGVPPGFAWWDSSNNAVPMTLTELNGLAMAMLMQGWAAFQHKQTKKEAARNVTLTAEEVSNIAW